MSKRGQSPSHSPGMGETKSEESWWRKPIVRDSTAVFVGIGIGIVISTVWLLQQDWFVGPLIGNAVRATLAVQTTSASVTQLQTLPTTVPSTPTLSSPSAPILQPVPTPTFDVRVENEFNIWDNPTDKMNINATKEITIAIDPDGLHQATCSNWNIQPEPLSLVEENGCRLTFKAVTNFETEVTVNVTIDGVVVPKTFVFHP